MLRGKKRNITLLSFLVILRPIAAPVVCHQCSAMEEQKRGFLTVSTYPHIVWAVISGRKNSTMITNYLGHPPIEKFAILLVPNGESGINPLF